MQKLVEGIHRFQEEIFNLQKGLFQSLVDGQNPQALFITCSDSRIDPNLLTQTDPGELFILRNAGNIVPPYGPQSGGEAATIEYAVGVLGVRDIIVCGHSHCGAMSGLLAPEQLADLPAVRAWLAHAEATARIMKENYRSLAEQKDSRALLSATVSENVLVQLENLRTHPCVLAAMSRRELKVHGWVYHFESGRVFAYDKNTHQFEPMDNLVHRPSDRSLARPSI
jgi:carbonic anhydrase